MAGADLVATGKQAFLNKPVLTLAKYMALRQLLSFLVGPLS